MSGTDQVYIRVKHRNQTFCFLCHVSDTMLSIKERVAAATKQHGGEGVGKAESLRLLLPKSGNTSNTAEEMNTNNTILKDDEKLSDYEDKIKEDTILYVVFPVADGEWESVDVVVISSAVEGTTMQE